jgi:hypothetical protein
MEESMSKVESIVFTVREGGSYAADPETGEVTRVAATKEPSTEVGKKAENKAVEPTVAPDQGE